MSIYDYNRDLVRKYVKPEVPRDSYDIMPTKSSPNFKKYCEFGQLGNFDDSTTKKLYEMPEGPVSILKNNEAPQRQPETKNYSISLAHHENFIKQQHQELVESMNSALVRKKLREEENIQKPVRKYEQEPLRKYEQEPLRKYELKDFEFQPSFQIQNFQEYEPKFEPAREKLKQDKFFETNERRFLPSKTNPIRMKDALFSLKNDLDCLFPVSNVHRPSLSMDRFEKVTKPNLNFHRPSKSENHSNLSARIRNLTKESSFLIPKKLETPLKEKLPNSTTVLKFKNKSSAKSTIDLIGSPGIKFKIKQKRKMNSNNASCEKTTLTEKVEKRQNTENSYKNNKDTSRSKSNKSIRNYKKNSSNSKSSTKSKKPKKLINLLKNEPQIFDSYNLTNSQYYLPTLGQESHEFLKPTTSQAGIFNLNTQTSVSHQGSYIQQLQQEILSLKNQQKISNYDLKQKYHQKYKQKYEARFNNERQEYINVIQQLKSEVQNIQLQHQMHVEQIQWYKANQQQSIQEKQVLIQTIGYLENLNQEKDSRIQKQQKTISYYSQKEHFMQEQIQKQSNKQELYNKLVAPVTQHSRASTSLSQPSNNEESKNLHKKSMSLKQMIKSIPKSTKNKGSTKKVRQISPTPLMALRQQYSKLKNDQKKAEQMGVNGSIDTDNIRFCSGKKDKN